MKEENNNLWIGTEDLLNTESFRQNAEQEFFNLPILNDVAKGDKDGGLLTSNRRDFLKYLGFGIGAATIAAACETPVRRALPYVVKPDTIVPGVATYYATSYVRSGNFTPVIVKTREGRPIKIEGNPLSHFASGGTSAQVQASVLDLYDTARLKSPAVIDGKKVNAVDWSEIDNQIKGKLGSGNIRILSNTVISPSSKAAIADFTSKYPNTKVVTYDAVSYSALLLANEKSFGKRFIPTYKFDEAKAIVTFGADFLGTWLSPVEFSAQFSKNRVIKDVNNASMSRLYAFESGMSLTGSSADHRILVKPSEQGLAVAKLYNAVAAMAGAATVGVSGNLANDRSEESIKAIAKDLWKHKSEGHATLIVSASNNTAEQLIVNKLNDILGNYGKTIDTSRVDYQRQGVDKDVLDLLAEMKSGGVATLLVLDDVNPVYDLPEGKEFAEAMSKVGLRVSFSQMPNETLMACTHSCPAPHFLESWGDAMPRTGVYSVIQPTISPLFKSRPFEVSLLKWSDLLADSGSDDPYYLYVQQQAQKSIFPAQKKFATFTAFWENTLHDGSIDFEANSGIGSVPNVDVNSLGGMISKPGASKLEISFTESVQVGAGQHANNPWLQEMPHPITRIVWDNYVSIPLKWNGSTAFEYFNNLKEDGDIVELTVGGKKEKLPIVRQFGQMQGTVHVSLGYGREVSGKAGAGVGKNMFYNLSRDAEGNVQYYNAEAQVSNKIGHDEHFASVQHHHTLGVRGKDSSDNNKVINVDEKTVMTLGNGYQGGLTKRSILRESTLSDIKKKTEELVEQRKEFKHLNKQTLYPGHENLYGQGHHWGLAIDLSACTGCGACEVACRSENNVPVVGKKEVARHHEMTWLRIDRYYYGDVENPKVFYQPMMCQHCDNAPCENVCPVAATNHSAEGLNQMAYNRCVGTRYCANNCPYKVRRFNWLDYTTADLFAKNENDPFHEPDSPYYSDNLTRMVLNPDVTVRSRGVIEKCSMCVQRIQEHKLIAKRENRDMVDGDLKPACASSCPTGGIVFGDLNNQKSQVSVLWEQPTTYFVLEEINVRPKVGYQMKVTNDNEEISKLGV